MINTLNEEYGSVQNYIVEELGITQDEIIKLQNMYLEQMQQIKKSLQIITVYSDFFVVVDYLRRIKGVQSLEYTLNGR